MHKSKSGNFMKYLVCLLTAFFVHQSAWAAEPAFYLVDRKPDGEVLLYLAGKDPVPKKPLSFVLLDTGKPACCFVIRAPKPRTSMDENGNFSPFLSSDEGGEAPQFVGQYKRQSDSRVAANLDNQLGFGLVGMESARLIGHQTFEIAVVGNPSKVIMRQCLSSEGVHFRFFHSTKEKKPFASYYLWLGYDIEPDCKE
jgi:hypothetical protein